MCRYLRAGGPLAALLAVAASCAPGPRGDESGAPASPPGTTPSASPQRSAPPGSDGTIITDEMIFAATGLPDTSDGRAIYSWIAAANLPGGPRARAALSGAMAVLKQRPQAVADTLRATYNRLPAGNYPTRWQMVFALSQLKDPAALGALEAVAMAPIPPEPKAPTPATPHQEDEAGAKTMEELAVRVPAVTGIAELAADGNESATRTLHSLLQSPLHVSLRVAGARRFMAHGDARESRRAQLSRMLPASDQWLLKESPINGPLVVAPTIKNRRNGAATP